MNKKLATAACGLVLITAPVFAQPPRDARRVSEPNKPSAKQRDDAQERSSGAHGMSMSQMTPEMWLYLQERDRHDDAKEAVRRKAEYRTAQRLRRMAAREWFGYSNARPTASPDPYHGEYSPHWSGNNAQRPDQWIGGSRSGYRR